MYALLIYQMGAECVCFVDLPERGRNVYVLLIYHMGAECVCFVDLPVGG